MTKEIRNPNDEGLRAMISSGFVIGHSFVVRASTFVIITVPVET
jgi:hypothetical protein